MDPTSFLQSRIGIAAAPSATARLRLRDMELLLAIHEQKVEAGSTKIIHLLIGANTRMLGVVPSDVGHDIERLGGVRHLPFPVSLSMPPVGLVFATRPRDTPVVRNVRAGVRELLRRRRVVK